VPPGFHPPVPPADRRIVDRNPDRNHHEPPPLIGEPVRRSTGPVGGRVADHDGDNHSGGDRGNKRIYTNDDVARVPRTDNPPPQPKPDVNNDRGRVDGDRNPKVVDQQPARDNGGRGSDFNRSRDNHQPTPEPVRRTNNEGTPPPTQTERQHTPPPQTFTPAPQRPTEHNMYTPPPAPVHQQAAPPPPPVVHQSAPPPAPVIHQSAPPPESHSRSSDDGSHAGRPK
jgi:hypothetical protein